MKLAVIGTKVETTSKSPLFQNHWLKKYAIAGHYHAINVTSDNLPLFLSRLAADGFSGINVTVPHKEAVYDYINQHGTLTETAKKMGAVNTVVVSEKGALLGENTDAYGFITNVASSPDLPKNWQFSGKKAFLIGAGGATRALIVGLQEAGIAEIFLTNRTEEKAQTMQKTFGGITVIPWEKKETVLPHTDILVNATSLGMRGELPLAIDLSTLSRTAIVTDIVYNPLITPLLADAKSQGNTIVDGLGMLLFQGRKSFSLWTGITPDVGNEERNLLLQPAFAG